MDTNQYFRTYQEEVRSRLDNWGGKIREIEEKARWIKDEASKRKFQEEIANLRSKKEQLSSRLNELDRAPKTSWGNLQSNVESAARDFRNSLNSTLNRFR